MGIGFALGEPLEEELKQTYSDFLVVMANQSLYLNDLGKTIPQKDCIGERDF